MCIFFIDWKPLKVQSRFPLHRKWDMYLFSGKSSDLSEIKPDFVLVLHNQHYGDGENKWFTIYID